mmetsp:Transcript_62226/g.122206  ORF Transcript_62226/g.122206 Transcript_62226/m.122206 type:complete len:105 (+) Transcript_62226:1514-1828(+)|eukprot:CAMPEP_0171665278 /NCGR_PEP_ID=MMETSP0990-20121206/47364_1 /TAXON_ID=483369 /ORGANISM="non described non described, Strain CCMP2098" /LENGTH=104 /DNA_ID=CAMNT_0012248477 /DNA_START=186 /DNA_END=500 /DNA_ORIENTATION=+
MFYQRIGWVPLRCILYITSKRNTTTRNRGFKEADFDKVAEFFDRGVKISLKIKEQTGKKLADYKKHLAPGAHVDPELEALLHDVEEFAKGFPAIGFDEATMVHP